MRIELLRKLRGHLAQHPLGFPITEKELELKMLDQLFTNAEAELALIMTARSETAEEIAKRADKPLNEVVDLLESMVKKCAIFKKKNLYNLDCYAPGMYEYQIKSLNKEMADLYFKLGIQWGQESMANKTSFMRTVAVEKALPQNTEIAPFERASEIVSSAKSIALADCICRTQRALRSKPCPHPKDEICIILNEWADYYIANNLARRATVEEGLRAIERGEKAGLVRQVSNCRNQPSFICQCCVCSCGALQAFVYLDMPTALVKSNYVPVIDREACTDCGQCIDRCPTKALSFINDHLEWKASKCIGCGLCVPECPSEALSMIKKAAAEINVPPADQDELLTIVAHETGRTKWYK